MEKSFFYLRIKRGNSELQMEHVGHLNFSGHLYGENDLSRRVVSLNQSWVSADFYSWFEALGMVLTLKLGGNIGGMWNNQLSTASMTSVPSHSEMLLLFFSVTWKFRIMLRFFFFFLPRLGCQSTYNLYTRTTFLWPLIFVDWITCQVANESKPTNVSIACLLLLLKRYCNWLV